MKQTVVTAQMWTKSFFLTKSETKLWFNFYNLLLINSLNYVKIKPFEFCSNNSFVNIVLTTEGIFFEISGLIIHY